MITGSVLCAFGVICSIIASVIDYKGLKLLDKVWLLVWLLRIWARCRPTPYRTFTYSLPKMYRHLTDHLPIAYRQFTVAYRTFTDSLPILWNSVPSGPAFTLFTTCLSVGEKNTDKRYTIQGKFIGRLAIRAMSVFLVKFNVEFPRLPINLPIIVSNISFSCSGSPEHFLVIKC
jgi:hypothetical protein